MFVSIPFLVVYAIILLLLIVNAAQILASIPAAMQLRYLQTLSEIGAEQNSTTIFPMPIDLIKPFLEILDKKAELAPSVAVTAAPTATLDGNGRALIPT